MKYIIILFSLLSFNVMAFDTDRLSITVGSYHATTDYLPANLTSYNQDNYGLAYEYNINDNLYSFHAGVILVEQYNDIEIGLNLGLVTGYYNDPMIFARPYIQYENIRVGFIPQIESLKTENTFTFEFIIKL